MVECTKDQLRKRLSTKELAIVKLYAKGHKCSEIARMLFRSVKTISTHRSRIKDKFGIVTDVEWMALLKKAGELDMGLPTEEEWRERFKKRLIERGSLPGIADDTEQSIILRTETYDYTLDDSPEDSADAEMAEWDETDG